MSEENPYESPQTVGTIEKKSYNKVTRALFLIGLPVAITSLAIMSFAAYQVNRLVIQIENGTYNSNDFKLIGYYSRIELISLPLFFVGCLLFSIGLGRRIKQKNKI
jgi:hypothetical protein